ncbi:MAG: alpha/beta fold hydrolase [Magnetococcales bacterium]|nr:alpha/beta fold hydrolase [Magnetococcales bacterium]
MKWFWLLAVGLFLGNHAAFAGDANAPLEWNGKPNRATCPDEESYAWVKLDQGKACIRYFSGGPVDQAPVAIVLFQGDRNRIMDRDPEEIRNNTRRAQEGFARSMTKKADIPVIVVERPGTYGSSGNHRKRRQLREFEILNAALDLIKERHGIKRFVLLGHSGGATAGAALLTLGRDDVRCAVLTSGAFALLERSARLQKAAGKKVNPDVDVTGLTDPYDPLEHVDSIKPDPKRMIYLLGNPQDKVTPFDLQSRFAKAVEKAGHRVALEAHAGQPPLYHNLLDNIGIRTAGRCGRE